MWWARHLGGGADCRAVALPVLDHVVEHVDVGEAHTRLRLTVVVEVVVVHRDLKEHVIVEFDFLKIKSRGPMPLRRSCPKLLETRLNE